MPRKCFLTIGGERAKRAQELDWIGEGRRKGQPAPNYEEISPGRRRQHPIKEMRHRGPGLRNEETKPYMSCRILINREESEVRVAFLDHQELVELHTEKFDDQTIVNNIYRGRVQDVVPGLQAAFVDVGLERNMFLHFMDIRPESLVLGSADQKAAIREASKKTIPGRIEQKGRRPRQDPNAPQAAAPVKKGDEIVVQVLKDEISGKAPRVTANLAIAGRYVVMLPFPSQEGGVSRKIAVGQDRFRLKKLLASLKTEDHSFIVRTAGLEQEEDPIRRDAENLEKTWNAILKRYKELGGPGLLKNDHDLIIRLVRDAFPPDFDEVICDSETDAQEVRNQLTELMPGAEERVSVFRHQTDNIFEYHGIESQIEKSLDRKFWLKSGGSLIIDENEALTAIDINTGRFTGRKDQEKTSLKTNLEACEAIAREIRLRDIGGIIVIDFIDMLSRGHQEKVADELRRQLRHDRAKTAIGGRIGEFGLMVLTRKRQRMSLQKQVFEDCPYCKGTGFVRRADEIFRKLKYDIRRALATESALSGVVVSAHPKFIDTLTSRFRAYFEQLKNEHRCNVVYQADPDFHIEDYQITPVVRTDDSAPRLAVERLEPDQRLVAAVAGVIETPVEPVEPAAKETAPEKKEERVEEAPKDKDEKQESAKRKRRRETSAERRARRKRARTMEEGETPESQAMQDEFEPETTEEPVGELPPISGEDIQPEPAQQAPEEEPKKRKTRRGTRGGRKRRQEAETETAAQDAKPADSPAPENTPEPAPAQRKPEPVAVKLAEPPRRTDPVPEQPAPLPPKPLTLKVVKKSEDDVLASFLERIEKDVETLKGSKKEPTAAPTEAAKVEPPAAEEKMPAAKKRTTRRKTTTKKAADTPAEESPKPEEPAAAREPKAAKKAPKRRTTKKATGDTEAAPAPRTRNKRTTATSAKAEEAPAEESKPTATRKATAARKSGTGTSKTPAKKTTGKTTAKKKTDQAATEEKPKRATRTRKKKTDTEKS